MSETPSTALAEGSLILEGRFRIIRLLGGGGMGLVYLAEQVSLGRSVAVKVLREDLSLQPGMAERFRREALLLSSVEHPAVVRVIDFGQSEGAACLVMDLVQGETLEAAVVQGPFALDRALRVLLHLAQGLSAIHARGIVHRDLKPDNVVLTQTPDGEQAKVLDFGIARLAAADVPGNNVTQVGFVLGTPEYLSPEQGLGQPLDARTDLYSFGVLAYRLLSGAHPFDGPTPRDYVVQHIQTLPRRLHEVAPALANHLELCGLVMRCLAKAREDRPESAAAIVSQLSQLAGLSPSGTGPIPIPLTARSSATPLPIAATAVLSKTPQPVQSRNLTLMLTDLKGYTKRTSEQSLAANARMLNEHDALLVPLLRRHDGRLVQKRGDALLAVFSSPTQALRCGMAMQDALWRFNSGRSEPEQLHVRVCIHAGEVVEAPEGVRGEPVTIITAVENVAEAGAVVFTDAVYLTMSRAEVASERWMTMRVAGRDEEVQLHRCTAATEGAPFGGRDLRKSTWPAAVQALVARVGPRLSVQLSVRARLAGAAAMLLTLISAGLMSALWRAPERQARRLIEGKRASEALQVLAEAKPNRTLTMLKAAALHRVGRHDEEQETVRQLTPGQEPIEWLMLEALAEDFGGKEPASVREVLAGLPKEGCLASLQKLASSEPGRSQWGALRFLDLEYGGQGLSLVELYSAALEPPDCRVRNVAARRLKDLKDPSALPALQRLKETPRRQGFFFSDDDCGQDQAGSAIRTIQRETKAVEPR